MVLWSLRAPHSENFQCYIKLLAANDKVDVLGILSAECVYEASTQASNAWKGDELKSDEETPKKVDKDHTG